MKQTFLRLLPLLLCSALAGPTHAATATLSSQDVKQYQRLDFSFDLVAEWRSPYDVDDISVDLEITTPSGRQLVLPAYFVAGASKQKSSWRATLAPKEAGDYRYRVAVQDDGKPRRTDLSGRFTVGKGADKGFLRVRDPWLLQFDNGELFRGVGENLAWENRDTDDSQFFKSLHEDRRFSYDQMLEKLAKHGGNFARVWMIYWNLPLDWQWVDNNARYQPTTSRFNESGIRRMDELLRIAEAQGVYLMVALDSHVGLMETGWEHSSYNRKNGGDAATPAEFFSSPAAKKRYKDKLRFLVAKWSHSPHIAAWEFFNEVDNAIYADKANPIPDQLVTAWHREMSDYLAKIDPHGHIITTSISHREVAGLNDLPHIDINQKHIYKGLESIPPTLQQLSVRHGKPFVIGEAGYEWDWKKNFDDFADGMKGDFKRQLWYGLFNPTPILPMSWWWEYFDERGLVPYFRGVQEINQRMLKAASGGTLKPVAMMASGGLRHFAVTAGTSTFVYLYNPGHTAVTTALTFPGHLPAKGAVTAYHPERQTAQPFKGSLDALELQAHQDLVLILDAKP